MKPFQIENQIANTFDIECTVSACSKTRNAFNGYCSPNNACRERYTPLGLLPNTWNEVATKRRRRDVESTVSELMHFKSLIVTYCR